LSDALKSDTADSDEAQKQQEALEKLFREAVANDKLKVGLESLKSNDVAGVILLSEQARRMQEMSRTFGGGLDLATMFPQEETLVLNRNHKLVQMLERLENSDAQLIASHLYDLAQLSHKPLSNEQMTRFIERSNAILVRIAEV